MISGVSSSLPFNPSPQSCQGPNGSCDDTQTDERALKQLKTDAAKDTEQHIPEKSVNTKDEAAKVKDELEKQSSALKSASGETLSEEEIRELEQLKQRDQEVRQHEAAHLAAAGQHARGGMSFSYKNGPDGRRYAVGGEVGIDTSPVAGDPQATLQKANAIRAAAMAPAEPSAQDRAVAAQAVQMAAQARQDIAKEQAEAMQESREKLTEETEESVEKAENDESGTHAAQKAADSYQQVAGITKQSPSSLKLDLVI